MYIYIYMYIWRWWRGAVIPILWGWPSPPPSQQWYGLKMRSEAKVARAKVARSPRQNCNGLLLRTNVHKSRDLLATR